MRTFTLTFSSTSPTEKGAIRFTAPDPRNALTILEQHPQHDRATVWEGSQKVCCITRSGVDVWHIT